MRHAKLIGSSVAVVGIVIAAACGGTVVFEEDGGRGNGDGGSGNGNGANGNGNTGSQASTPNAGTAGPGGVGGADNGPTTGQSSQGVAGSGCLFVEQTEQFCYKHSTCTDLVRETECEETQIDDPPGKCWCFIEGEFVAECVNEDGFCNVGANGDCCARAWPR